MLPLQSEIKTAIQFTLTCLLRNEARSPSFKRGMHCVLLRFQEICSVYLSVFNSSFPCTTEIKIRTEIHEGVRNNKAEKKTKNQQAKQGICLFVLQK